MRVKSSSVISFVLLVAFSCSLVLVSINTAWADDTQEPISVSVLPVNIITSGTGESSSFTYDTYFKSYPAPEVSIAGAAPQFGITRYAWNKSNATRAPVPTKVTRCTIQIVTGSFAPADHDRWLMLTLGFSREANFDPMSGTHAVTSWNSNGQASTGQGSNSFYKLTNITYTGTSGTAYLCACAIRIPAGAVALKCEPALYFYTNTFLGSSGSFTSQSPFTPSPAVEFCTYSNWVSDSQSDYDLYVQMLDHLSNMDLDLDTQITLLNVVSTRLSSIDSTTQSIYSLLHDALKDESQALDNESEKAAETIMQQDNSEQYWSDKNTENFEAIGLENFSFDGGILNGLQRSGSLFANLWESLGDATIIYTFPLMLGIALVAIGRISRAGGIGKKRGEDDD